MRTLPKIADRVDRPEYEEMAEAVELLLDLGIGDSGGSAFARDVICSWSGDPKRGSASVRETNVNLCVDIHEVLRMSGNFVNAMLVVTRGCFKGMTPSRMGIEDDWRYQEIMRAGLSRKSRK